MAFDAFGKKSAKLTNVQRYANVQGERNLTNTGKIGAGGAGGFNLQGKVKGNNNTITVQSLDANVVEQTAAVNLAALQANQSVSNRAIDQTADVAKFAMLANTNALQASLDYGSGIATAAINAAHQQTMNSLETVRGISERNAALTGQAVASAQEIALTATPVGPGFYSNQQNKLFIALALAVTAAIVLPKLLK